MRAVYGPQKRIIAILSYHTQPGRSGSPRYFSACLLFVCHNLISGKMLGFMENEWRRSTKKGVFSNRIF